MKKILNYTMLCSTIALLTGCDLNLNTDDDKKFDLINIDKSAYLINNTNGDLFKINIDNTKEQIIKKEYKDIQLSKKDTIDATDFDIKSKIIQKEDKIIYQINLKYKKENDNTKVPMDTWRDMLRSGNYRITLHFLDKDGFMINQKDISLQDNIKFNSFDGYTIGAITNFYSGTTLEVASMSYSYILPEYKDINSKYLIQNGKKLTYDCSEIQNTFDKEINFLYSLEDINSKLEFVPNEDTAKKIIETLDINKENNEECLNNIDYNRNLLGKNSYYKLAINALNEIKEKQAKELKAIELNEIKEKQVNEDKDTTKSKND